MGACSVYQLQQVWILAISQDADCLRITSTRCTNVNGQRRSTGLHDRLRSGTQARYEGKSRLRKGRGKVSLEGHRLNKREMPVRLCRGLSGRGLSVAGHIVARAVFG